MRKDGNENMGWPCETPKLAFQQQQQQEPSDVGFEARKASQRFNERLVRFDVLGIVLAIPGRLMLTYSFTSANVNGWGSGQALGILVASLVLIVLFAAHERTAAQALIPAHLFRSLTPVLSIKYLRNLPSLRLLSHRSTAVIRQQPPSNRDATHSNARWRADCQRHCGALSPGPRRPHHVHTFPSMILSIAGVGAVYIAANFVVISAASRAEQGTVAGLFSIALQGGGSVFGLAVLTAVAQGLDGILEAAL